MKLLKSLLISFLVLTFATPASAIGPKYSYPLYPYKNDLSQTLTFKIMLRCALENDYHNLDLGAVAEYLKKIDCISRGLPKVVILGGFQQGGHDHTYPWWAPIDSTLYAPGGLKGGDALRWLMNEAKKYNVHCTFHVNPFDAYEDSPKWDMYVEKDLLCRDADGSLHKGDVWWNRQSYFVNMVNEWNAGVTQQRIDEFIEQVPLVKETGVLYFDNQTQYPPSLYHFVTREDQISAIKKAAEYLKTKYGIQLVGEYADTNLYGVCSLGVTWDWWASLNINQMEVAPYIACGGRDGTHDELYGGKIDLTKRRFQVFGASLQLEDTQFQRAPFKVARELSHHTFVYFYLNRLLRLKYETEPPLGITLTLSDNVVSKWEKDNVHRLYRDGKLMKEGHDVFIPIFWVNHPEIMAYSVKGRKGYWDFPREWKGVNTVDIYGFNDDFTAIVPVEKDRKVSDNRIWLEQEPDVARIIVPAGTDMTDRSTIYDNPPSGEAAFMGRDTSTGGDWNGKYGARGYEVFGLPGQLSEGIKVAYTGDSLKILNADSHRKVALQRPDGKGRIEAIRTSTLHQIIDVTTDRPTMVSLYVADYRNRNCQEVIDVIDCNTKRILASHLINGFDNGAYVSFNIAGNVQVRITRFFYDGYKDPDYPVCSGIFFDEIVPNGYDWANFKYYEEANRKLTKAPTVVFMGNSITDSWGSLRSDFFTSHNFAGRGIAGQTSSHMLARFQEDVIDLHPKAVAILAGINDIAQNNGPITIERIFKNIKSMCQIARSNGIDPVICSVLPANRLSWNPKVFPAKKVVELNTMLQEYAKANKILYIDYYTPMVDANGGLPTELSGDGVHPTHAGYEMMEKIALKSLKKYLK